MARPELIEAYERSLGRIIGLGGKERDNSPDIPGSKLVMASDAEVEKYKIHGLANIKIPMDSFSSFSFIIDTQNICMEQEPAAAWTKQASRELIVRVSSGKPYAKTNSVWIEKDRNLQGLLIRTTQLSRKVHPAPYKAEITPLYQLPRE